MKNGFYVVRRRHTGKGRYLIIESVRFCVNAKVAGDTIEDAKNRATSWGEFVKSQHPKDHVYVIEMSDPIELI